MIHFYGTFFIGDYPSHFLNQLQLARYVPPNAHSAWNGNEVFGDEGERLRAWQSAFLGVVRMGRDSAGPVGERVEFDASDEQKDPGPHCFENRTDRKTPAPIVLFSCSDPTIATAPGGVGDYESGRIMTVVARGNDEARERADNCIKFYKLEVLGRR